MTARRRRPSPLVGKVSQSAGRTRTDRASQSGQAVVIVVAIIVALTVLGVMVFDAGLAMSDRRNLQAYADASALAGARSYGPGGNKAHWVAMQYLGSALGFGTPVGPCASSGSCPAGTYTVPGYRITLTDSWRVNGILNYPSVLDGVNHGLDYHTTDGGPMPPIPNIAPPTVYEKAAPVPPNFVYTSAAAAKDGAGNWKPGIYNGFAPSGGTMNGGVYEIINASSMSLGSITNTMHTVSGMSDPAGAVAIVIDGSDGGLDISQAVLNGLDDLNGSTTTGLRDPMGTHNFVIWGGGSNPYTAGVTIGPHAGPDMSGIIYLPKSPNVSDGNSSPSFTGSVIVDSMTVRGRGNGQQA